MKTGSTKKGCDLTLLALEYDPVAQGQTNSDKRKSDAVFGCLLDDRAELGLSIAEEIDERSEQVLLYAAGLAVSKDGSIDAYVWLVDNLKEADSDKIELAIEEMGKYDVVVQSTLREVFLDYITPMKANLKLVV